MNDLKGKRVAIIVTDGFEQIEMTSPREALDKAGAKTVLVSPKDDQVQGFTHHDRSEEFKVDLPLAQANASDFDALVLPGGVINGDALRMEKRAQQFAQEMDRAGKPIAVICHGGWLLISAGLVKGRRITTWPTLQDDMRTPARTGRIAKSSAIATWSAAASPTTYRPSIAKRSVPSPKHGRRGRSTQSSTRSACACEAPSARCLRAALSARYACVVCG